MKFVSVRDLRGKSADIWRDLPEEREMVITSNCAADGLVTGNSAHFPPEGRAGAVVLTPAEFVELWRR